MKLAPVDDRDIFRSQTCGFGKLYGEEEAAKVKSSAWPESFTFNYHGIQYGTRSYLNWPLTELPPPVLMIFRIQDGTRTRKPIAYRVSCCTFLNTPGHCKIFFLFSNLFAPGRIGGSHCPNNMLTVEWQFRSDNRRKSRPVHSYAAACKFLQLPCYDFRIVGLSSNTAVAKIRKVARSRIRSLTIIFSR